METETALVASFFRRHSRAIRVTVSKRGELFFEKTLHQFDLVGVVCKRPSVFHRRFGRGADGRAIEMAVYKNRFGSHGPPGNGRDTAENNVGCAHGSAFHTQDNRGARKGEIPRATSSNFAIRTAGVSCGRW